MCYNLNPIRKLILLLNSFYLNQNENKYDYMIKGNPKQLMLLAYCIRPVEVELEATEA